MEKMYKVDTFVKLLFCDECGVEMKRTDNYFLTNPIQYTYMCEKCKKQIRDFKCYPLHFAKIIEEVEE